MRSVLAAIRETDPALGAFVAVADDRAIAEAEAADGVLARLGEDAFRELPLLGVTVAVKDLVQTRDLPTTRGSLLPNRRPDTDPLGRGPAARGRCGRGGEDRHVGVRMEREHRQQGGRPHP